MGFLRFGAAVLCLQSSLTALALSTDYIASRAYTGPVVNRTECVKRHYTYQELAGYGFVPSNARDKFGDTLGGFGSSIALDRKTWQKDKGVYTGILWTLPDRGWYGHDPSRRTQRTMLMADSALKEHARYPELSDSRS